MHDNIVGTLHSIGVLRGGLNNGGGGSVVEITPTTNTGQKIADYSIDGVAGELYNGVTPDAGFTVTDLWDNDSALGVGTYTMLDSIDNYDMLEIWYGVYSEYGTITDSKTVTVDTMNELYNANKSLLLTGYGNRVDYVKMNTNQMQIVQANDNTVLKVRGIKF